MFALLAASRDSPPASAVSVCARAHPQVPQALEGSGADAAADNYTALSAPAEAGEDPQLLRTSLSSELELGGELSGQLADYDPSGIRRLRQLEHGSETLDYYYYVPGTRTSLLSAACLRTLTLAQQRLIQAHELRYPAGPAYCLVGVIAGEVFPLSCGTLEQPQAGYTFGLSRTYDERLVGLVPNGVATVRISYRKGVETSGAVSENLFIAAAPKLITREPTCQAAAARPRGRPCTLRELLPWIRAATPLAVSWLGPTGAPVQRFTLSRSVLREAEAGFGLTD